MNKRKLLACAGALLLASTTASVTWAASFPERPIRILVPFSPGGLSDALIRVMADQAGQLLGQPMVVENRPGAAGRLMYHELQRAPADGYTVGYISTSAPVLAVTSKELPYDVTKDFEGIALIGNFGGYLAISTDVPAKNGAEFVEYARQNPDKLAYGSFGIGSQTHLQTEVLLKQIGTTMVHVPYGGEAPNQQALARNDIQMAILATYPQNFVDSGRIRVLGTTLSQRSPLYPDLPTVREAGMESIEASAWAGIAAPVGLPETVRDQLTDAFRRATQSAEVTQRLQTMGYIVRAEPGAAVAEAVRDDMAYYTGALERAGLTVDDIPSR